MVDFLLHYRYIAFFIGMIIGGDLVLITGVYFAVQRQFDIHYLIILALTATVISDLAWYSIGKILPNSRFAQSSFFQKNEAFITNVKLFFNKHSLKTVFYSKFIYGTRTVIQLLSGANKVKLSRFIVVDFVGTLSYLFLIIVLGYTLKLGLDDLEKLIHNVQITFAIFIVVLFSLNLLIQKNIKKHLIN